MKKFKDGSFLQYDRGRFDNWCVYLTEPSKKRIAPKDVDYFSELQEYAKKYGKDKIYKDYVSVYEMTGTQVEEASLEEITKIASDYEEDSLRIDIIFSILYMAMIAEENKEHTRLGKRIKRLGIYYLLIESKEALEAANFMRGMNWQEIDRLCKEKEF